jgi:hypothetical protein
MKKLFFVLFAGILLLSVSCQKGEQLNQLTKKEKAEGWVRRENQYWLEGRQ